MFDITSTLKKFFISEESSVNSCNTASFNTSLCKDSLSQASLADDFYSSSYLLKLQPRKPSSFHQYYFFEQETKEPTPAYVMQENSSQEITHPMSLEILKLLGDKVRGQGVCKQSLTGLVYLDISVDYLTKLAPFFTSYGGKLPQLQAHIAIISPDEAQKAFVCLQEEIGSSFSFDVRECKEISIDCWKGVEKVWILKVYSEELEALRKKYHLCPRLCGKDFHILISLKPSLKSAVRQECFKISPLLLSV